MLQLRGDLKICCCLGCLEKKLRNSSAYQKALWGMLLADMDGGMHD